MHIRVSESTDKEWEFSELRRAAKGNEFLGVPWRPEGCEANDKKSRILSTRQLKSQDAYLSPSEFTSWELPGVCAVLSRSASLQMSHFILRSMRSSLLQLHRRQLLKNCSCSDFWPSTPMQLWFQALFGIFNARISICLRIGCRTDFSPIFSLFLRMVLWLCAATASNKQL